MADIKITINKEQMDDLMTRLAEIKNGTKIALSRAINKTCKSTQVDMVTMAKETHNYYADALKARLLIHRATWSNLSGKVVSTGQPIHLFDMIGTSWPGPHSAGVRVNVVKATGSHVLKSSWFGPAKHQKTEQNIGKSVVYSRTSDPGIRRRTEPPGRYPIQAMFAPHPELVYNKPSVWKSIQYLVDFNMEKHLNHEVDAIILKYAPSDEGL
jgi:hypothetical protein